MMRSIGCSPFVVVARTGFVLLYVFALAAAGVAWGQSDPVTDDFELGDSALPELAGSGELLSVGGVPGPDWEELFNADGSLKDLVDASDNPSPNGIPDFIDRYQGRAAVFVRDDISAGTLTDLSIRFGSDRLETGSVTSSHDLGNAYLYTASDSAGNLLLYMGFERLTTSATSIEVELNQGVFRLGHGFPGTLGWEIVGQREANDLRLVIDLGVGGLLTSLSVDGWQDPEQDGSFTWVRRETLSLEGCNVGDPEASPPIDPQTLCAFSNDLTIAGGDWQSFDATGAPVDEVGPNCFFELGLNVGMLLDIPTPGPTYQTVRLRSPNDLAFGYFGGGTGSGNGNSRGTGGGHGYADFQQNQPSEID